MWKSSSSAFEDSIAARIESTGTQFLRNVPLRGLQADFLLMPSMGRTVVIEAKNWDPTPANIQRAAMQAGLIQQASGSTEAYVVIPGPLPAPLPPGVVRLEDLPQILGPAPTSRPHLELIKLDPAPAPVFAAMPFSADYDDVFYVAIAHAAEKVRAVARRVDQEVFQGDVVAKIQALIRTSAAVVADLSEGRANVMYEVGYAHALGRATVHLCSTPLDQLPFDVRNWNTIEYAKGQTHALRDKLAIHLAKALENARSA